MNKLTLALVSFVILGQGCASKTPKTPTPDVTSFPASPAENAPPKLEWSESYFSELRDRLDPAWLEILKPDVEKKIKAGTNMNSLGNFESTVEAEFEVLADGVVTNVKITKRSKYKSFSAAAKQAIEKSSPLPPPPSACFKDAHCNIHWKFKLTDYRSMKSEPEAK